MGGIKDPGKALIMTGLIHDRAFDLELVMPEVIDRLGEVALRSDTAAFYQTDYYASEMGEDLVRQWLVFAPAVAPEGLADLKLWSNAVEERHRSPAGGRLINIDPGLMTLNNLILASTKNYSHRIYLGQGIFAEVTLIYRRGRFQALEWTYPDYKTPAALDFFGQARTMLKEQLTKDKA